jgi:hypothetical protein
MVTKLVRECTRIDAARHSPALGNDGAGILPPLGRVRPTSDGEEFYDPHGSMSGILRDL